MACNNKFIQSDFFFCMKGDSYFVDLALHFFSVAEVNMYVISRYMHLTLFLSNADQIIALHKNHNVAIIA